MTNTKKNKRRIKRTQVDRGNLSKAASHRAAGKVIDIETVVLKLEAADLSDTNQLKKIKQEVNVNSVKRAPTPSYVPSFAHSISLSGVLPSVVTTDRVTELATAAMDSDGPGAAIVACDRDFMDLRSGF